MRQPRLRGNGPQRRDSPRAWQFRATHRSLFPLIPFRPLTPLAKRPPLSIYLRDQPPGILGILLILLSKRLPQSFFFNMDAINNCAQKRNRNKYHTQPIAKTETKTKVTEQ